MSAASRNLEILELESLEIDPLMRLYTGDMDLIVLRGLIDQTTLKSFRDAFWNHPPSWRRPPAPSYQIGVHHFGLPLETYLDRAKAIGPTLKSLGGDDNPVLLFQEALASELRESGLGFRLAKHDGRDAAPYIVRSWANSGAYALLPHDDTAQLHQENQRGFEIQDISEEHLVATNICVSNPECAKFVVWDFIASDDVRRDLHILQTGYPYPEYFLEKLNKRQIEMSAGDVILLRGQVLHAVESSNDRVVASYFSGILEKEIVVWT